MPWDHGYYTGQTYCPTVMPEMAPAWMDFAALVKGQAPPRDREGAPFRYLDLGCGTGLGLCLLAALYPEGDFLGVDFMPAHIAEGRWLARSLQLDNVRFLEGDLVELADRPQSVGEAFDYVVAHGLYTWVDATVQEAVLNLTEQVLLPGGLFYCSYNTQPGWLGRSAFRMLARLERDRHPSHAPRQAFDAAQRRLEAVLSHAEAPFSQSQPQLLQQLPQGAVAQNLSYLCGEYFAEAWQPLYVSEVHPRFRAHKLEPVATSTLSQLHEGFLNPAVAPLVLEEHDPMLRQATFDLLLNQGFRRDLCAKGVRPLPETVTLQRLLEVPLQRLDLRPCQSYTYQTPFGLIDLEPKGVRQLENALGSGAMAIGDLCLSLGEDLDTLLPRVLLLLENRRIGLARGQAAPAAETVHRINQQLRRWCQQGYGINHQLLPAVGTALSLPLVESMLLDGLLDGLKEDALTSCILMALNASGEPLRNKEGQPVQTIEEQAEQIQRMLQTMETCVLPLMIQCGGLHTAAATQGP